MVSGKVEKQDCTELNGRSESPGQNDRKIPVCNGAKTRKPLKPGSDGVVRLSGGNLQIARSECDAPVQAASPPLHRRHASRHRLQ